MYQLEIEINLSATDPNRTAGKSWKGYKKTKDKIKNEMRNLVRGKEPSKPLQKFRISVVRHSPRTMDFDNLVASLKVYIDCFTRNGIIQNDSWKFIKNIQIDQIVSQEKKLVFKVESVITEHE